MKRFCEDTETRPQEWKTDPKRQDSAEKIQKGKKKKGLNNSYYIDPTSSFQGT